MSDTKASIACKRYAEAFILATAGEDFEECFKDLEVFAAIYSGYEGLKEVLTHPTIHIERKLSMLQSAFASRLHQQVLDFISLLVRRERISRFDSINLEITRLYRQKKGIKDVTVRSAVALHSDERIRLHEVLSRKFGRVEIREIIDKTVVGGLIIYLDDKVIDESIRSRIRQLREMMLKVDAIWMATLSNQPSVAL